MLAGSPPARYLLCLYTFASACLFACRSSAPNGAELPSPRNDMEAFCDETLGTMARSMTECCTSEELSGDAFSHAALSYESRKTSTLICQATTTHAVRSGRARFDAEAARKCARTFSAWARQGRFCGPEGVIQPVFASSPCDRVLVGLQDVSQPCTSNEECRDGLSCVGWRVGVDGQCKPPSTEGGACGAGEKTLLSSSNIAWGFGQHPPCAPGLQCWMGQCRPRQPGCGLETRDASCRVGVGKPCRLDLDCFSGLYCDSADPSRRSCQPKRPHGSPCSSRLSGECRGTCVTPGPGLPGTCASVCRSG